ncbi:CBS domain-containing protein [Streptomyces griseosporeus]|uniref:CBS domain-containing protein n=1 Tax=Streptomyces griseosporeus TaxID=1910 RepID=UPI0036FF4B7B
MTAEAVREVMTPGVVAVPPEASLAQAARLMRSGDVGDVLVVDGQQLVGVLTDRDIAVRAVAEGADPRTTTAQSVCTPHPVAIGPDEPVAAAVTLMRECAVRRLPVVSGGRPVGMVSLGDLALDRDPDSVLAEIARTAPDGGRA